MRREEMTSARGSSKSSLAPFDGDFTFGCVESCGDGFSMRSLSLIGSGVGVPGALLRTIGGLERLLSSISSVSGSASALV